MKKLFTFALGLFGLTASAQTSSIALFQHLTTVAVVPNATMLVATAPGTITTITLDVQNTSGASKSYNCKRYDMILNRVSSEDTAAANFCFGGQCYGSFIYTSLVSLTLTAGQNSGALAQYYSLDCDMIEASKKGFGMVKYTIFNENNVNDSVQFTIQYNKELLGTGIKEQTSATSIRFYPNPVKDIAMLSINAADNKEAEVKIYNSLGDLVYARKYAVNSGSNQISLDLSALSAGVYITEIKEGTTVSTKKLIVE